MKLSLLLLASFATYLYAQSPGDDKRLLFSTYHGGDRNDDAVAVAVDSNGFVYVAGETESRDLPSTPVGGKPLTFAVFKGYLTKYSPDGKQVIWRALIGGSSNTVPHAVTLDKDGNIFVAGTTGARDLPLKNPVQDKQPGLNIAFVMKFDPNGELLFSTFYGGERNEEGKCLATDSQGNLYLAGRATSTTFPVVNAIQPKFGGSEDGFIVKFTPDLKVAYATYFGGASADQIHAIAVGPDDSLYVTGETLSAGLSTEDAYIKQVQSYSSFVARINPEGNSVVYFSYVGWRGGYTTAKALAVDNNGRAWIGGHTTSKQLTTTENAFQPAHAGGARDGFLLRLAADGKSADYLSYLGGSSTGPNDPDEAINVLKIDARGHLHIAGFTNSADFPGNTRAMQGNATGAFDAFVLRMDPDNKQIFYSTFWGGQKNDSANALALGPGEVVTFVGNSTSADLPVSANAVQGKPGSTDEGFVAKFCDPWLGSWSASGWAGETVYVLGAERLAAVELDVYSGCPQKFAVKGDGPELEGAAWLTVTNDGGTVPMKLKLEFNTDGLEAGEYKTTIRVTVPDAFYPTLEIPVVLKVVAPEPAS